MSPLSIAIDVRLWDAFWTGTSAYMRGICGALGECDEINRYLLLTGPRGSDGPLVKSGRFRELAVDAPHIMDERWEQITLPTDLASLRIDLLFAPGGIIPIARDFRAIPVIHDLGFLHHPEFYEPRLQAYLAKWIEMACRTGDAVVCNSEFTRESVVDSYGIPAERCEVVYPGIGREFTAGGDAAERNRIRLTYGLDRPYVLTVSSGGRNKNLPRAIETMRLAHEMSGDLDYLLAVVGPEKGILSDSALQGGARLLEGRVAFLGRVPTEDLAALYRCADLFFFPSLYEGFGIPPIEAMACGTPVLASNRASLPEVLGGAARLCDPENPEEMASAMIEVLGSDDIRGKMSRAGRRRASRYSWTKSACRLLEVFRKVREAE